MYLKVPQIVYYSCESIPLNFTLFCHIYFFSKCPSKVRFAQTNRLNGQKLSDIRLLFPPLYMYMYVCTHVYIKYTYDSLLCPKKIFIKDHSLNISIIYYFTFPHVA